MKKIKIWLFAAFIVIGHNSLANTFKTEKWLTKNGTRVVFYQAKEVPILDISIAFAAGSAYDGERYGLSYLTTQMLSQGDLGQDATALAEAFAENGSQMNSETSRDMVVLSLKTLTNPKALEASVNTFGHMIAHPDFPVDAFAREKQQLLRAIEQAEESPDELANIDFFKNLYQQHPYAHPVKGIQTTVSDIERSHLLSFYQGFFNSNNAVLVMVGAIDKEKAHQIADQLTHDLPQGQPALPISEAQTHNHPTSQHLVFDSSQTVIRLGQIGINHQDSDYFPLMAGNYLLGGGSMVSRLAVEVREKRGLTYGISSQFVPMAGKGPFIISFTTKHNQTAQALKVTQDTVKQFIQNGPTTQELEAAKHYLTGSFPLALASNSAIASLLLRMAFYHLPDNYLDSYVAKIQAVTVEDIKMAFQRKLHPQLWYLVTVGRP